MEDNPTVKKIPALFLIFALCAAGLTAQTNTAVETETGGNRPSWLRDLRRWEIVAFGSFPFTMFFSTIGVDLFRWNRANGMDWNNRQYAPWPIKTPGTAMTDREQRVTIGIAVGLSAAVAVADHLIVQARRRRERQRAEAIPVGTVVITRTPLYEEPEEPDAPPEDDDAYRSP